MIKEFVKEAICVKVTTEDLSRLDELQNAFGSIVWESGTPINSKKTELRVLQAGCIYIICAEDMFGVKCCNFTNSETNAREHGEIITADEFISSGKPLNFSEDDLINML